MKRKAVSSQRAGGAAEPTGGPRTSLESVEEGRGQLVAAPARLGALSLAAFYHEVVLPTLRTLGFITMQTLG